MQMWRKTLYLLIAASCLVTLVGTRWFCYHSGYHLSRALPDAIILSIPSYAGIAFAILLSVFVIESAALCPRTEPPRIWTAKPEAISAYVSTLALLVLLAVTGLRIFVCGVGDNQAFLKGVKDRLEREIDPQQLQSWANGMMPETPQKKGSPIHLPNGLTVAQNLTVCEDGSFSLPPEYLPPGIRALFGNPPPAMVRFDPCAARRHVDIGFYGERFGLKITVGSTNFVREDDVTNLKWRDGIYVSKG